MKKILFIGIFTVWILSSVTASAYSEADYSKKLDEVYNLLIRCEENDIPVSYEKAAYTVLRKFKGYMEEDIENGEAEERIEYNENYLEKLYTETKEKLNGYLDGTIEIPKKTEFPNAFDRKISGRFIVDKDGKNVFSVGYGHFSGVVDENDDIAALGMDNIAVEVGVENVIAETGVSHWQLNIAENTTAERNLTDENYALKLSSTANTMCSFEQLVPVDTGASYTVTAKVKTDDNLALFWMKDTKSGVKKISDADGWQTFSWEISADSNFYNLRFGISTKTVGIYFDDITMCKTGTEESIIKNSSFDVGRGYRFRTYSYVIRALETAERNNMTCNVLFRAAYLPNFFKEIYSEATTYDASCFNTFAAIINHKDMLKLYEEFYAFTAHMLKDYRALGSIILENEPRYETLCAKEFYTPKFRDWLRKSYNNDISALDAAYSAKYESFDTINMPDDFEYSSGRVFTPLDYDWMCFNEDMVTEFFVTASNAVRKVCNVPLSIKIENPLCFQSYGNSFKRLRYGINIEKLNRTFDFAGNDNFSFRSWPATRSDAMAWYDMLSSLTGKPIYNSEDHVIEDESGYFTEEQARYVRYNLWQGAVHGKVMSSLWLYKRASDYDALLERPDCVFEASKTSLQLVENTDIVSEFVNKDFEIALLYSKASRLYSPTKYPTSFYNAYKTAVATGHKVGFVTEQDIKKLDKYTVLIVPGVAYTTAEALDGIKNYIAKGGRVICTGSDCFTGDVHKTSLDSDSVKYVKQNSVLTNSLHDSLQDVFEDKLKITDLNGKPLENIDWQYIVKDGKVYVNVCNIGDAETDFQIMYAENVIEKIDDVLENKETEKTLLPTVPKLLSFDAGELKGRVIFEKLSFTRDGKAQVKNLCENAQRVTVAAVLRDAEGKLKGVCSVTKIFRPQEADELRFSFGDMAEEDTCSLEIWNNLTERKPIEILE